MGFEALPEEVAKKMEAYNIAKDAAIKGLQSRKTQNSRGATNEDDLIPPDDFRQISVFPTHEDLDRNNQPFLRKNKQMGGYTSVDHYLDVQFRLLREDFISPLRDGIAEYQDMARAPQAGKRLKDIRVIHDVHILRALCTPFGLGHRLTFDLTGLERVRWEVSKRLIYGALVCLSADEFQTLYFATVTNRDPEDLRKGIVDVMFEHNLQEISAIPPETSFTMAETTAYFEAYRHVLAGLKNMEDPDLPFQTYIVHCQKDVVQPKYLKTGTKYDLRPLVDEKVQLREDTGVAARLHRMLDLVPAARRPYNFSPESRAAENVAIKYRQLWPDPRLLHLDETQFEALHCALTKEFSVIQGPPGTGKTYVGLKIVKALLHNREAWDPGEDSTMLIVCYTNHALDQFLEGIISFFNGRVVRVGSQLRSEKLEPYSLANQRQAFRHQRDDMDRGFREITRLRFQGHEAMEVLKKEVDTMGLKIESARREIPHEDVLQRYMLQRHYDALQMQIHMMERDVFFQQGRKRGKTFAIPQWLGIDGVLNNAGMTMEELVMLQQELEEGEVEEIDIEGDIQAMENRHRLDVDITNTRDTRKQKEKESRAALAQERRSYLALDISNMDQGPEPQGNQGGFMVTREQRKRFKRQLMKKVASRDRMNDAEERQVRDIWAIDLHQRWRLFRLWTHRLCRALQADLRDKERMYDELAKRHKETLMQEDKHILKSATVVAMTTTAAARYQGVLQEVKPRVIVVEEAAEVLEGHVITTLNENCQHLILIGDHKQLRPNPTVYALARKYNLELSLFERMINNGVKCNTLGWQHRMRPEIAELVHPIYPSLHNHPSVEGYEDVKGVSSNVFFINHGEAETSDSETKSHSNMYEARYMAQLCLYLLKQGYQASRITVLTTYSGQLYQLRRQMPKNSLFDGVRVTVVDNFQGEENDIILLSLVRSNEEGRIGFLKTENRVCVALSRAKMGLYVIANFDQLSADNDLWLTITTKLKAKGQLGETLNLYCQNHPRDEGLVIRTPKDFDRAPEGGCMKPCKARLDCGHVCTRLCHPYDKDHANYTCVKKCERRLNCAYGHRCQKLCHQKCGECQERVQKKMPLCGHMQWMMCSQEPMDFKCQEKCDAVLECGHKCGDKCGMRHRCYEKVEVKLLCGHKTQIQCADRHSAVCAQKCDKLLKCGHPCVGTCAGCYGGRLHKRCTRGCTRVLVCGHECGDTCSNCPPCDKPCENRCTHSACQKTCGKLCVPCMEPCVWRCPHYRCKKLCSEPCDRVRCTEPCPKRLACEHPCIGLCGEPCPKLCRVCDQDKVTEIFFGTEDDPDARFVELEDCGHMLEVSGLDQWMTTTTDQQEDSVQLKACPLCKTPIRRHLRYGSIIKTQLHDIETIKRQMLGDEHKREATLVTLKQTIISELDPYYRLLRVEMMETEDQSTLGGLVAVENAMKLLDETKKLRDKAMKKLHGVSLLEGIRQFEEWICTPRLVFGDQEREDAQTEVLRLRHWLALLSFKEVQGRYSVPEKETKLLASAVQFMKNGNLYTPKNQEVVTSLLKKLEKLVPKSGLGISTEEKDMVLKAMALSQGHWFKCPNGHIYAIGDCGGAMQESRCPECKANIGGTNHRLLQSNTLASEMDGARYAAWSEQANLDNFALDDLI
ncbi:NFX1-type zinc finger-containing protein 1-like [Babylonia areolata]|uniref:NFX1-type zinc finger-containing protein 1-like n=1 Tax=Babylonia areolata TaxID=304850 RepID=UPI003FD4F703